MKLYCASCLARAERTNQSLVGWTAINAEAQTIYDGTALCAQHLVIVMDRALQEGGE